VSADADHATLLELVARRTSLGYRDAMAEPKLRMGEGSYLALDRASEIKHELWDGEVYAMAGASLAHNLIVGNLLRHLGNALDGSGCRPLPSDMRLRVSRDRYLYPDVTIVCGPPSLDGESDVLLNPSTIIEVLSASTAAFDRGDKFAAYRSIVGLDEVVFVSQHEARVETFTRQADDSWLMRESLAGGALALRSLSVPLPLERIYESVELGTADSRAAAT
jgi:Uma2 family endonuclease